MKRNLLLTCCIFLLSLHLSAQTDEYVGTWQMGYTSAQGKPPIHIQLQVAVPEKNILYPAHISIQGGDFKGDYELLLVRKNSRELGISRNKCALSETPFSMGAFPTLLNGIFDYSKDFQGIPSLSIRRMELKQSLPTFLDTANIPATLKLTAMHIGSFMKEADIKLIKINATPWTPVPHKTNPYFGIQDTLALQTRDGMVSLIGNKKSGNDIVTLTVNGRISIDRLELNKKKYTEDILLDTGMNILIFFTEDFGNALPGKGRMDLDFGNRRVSLDFANKADSATSFIVVKLYCIQDKAKEKSFQINTSMLPALKKNERLITNIISTSKQITLAIWDDAAEDGDSVSINIDSKWIAQGFPVKKNPQFLTVTLKPGQNTITFIADNLGSIPPNTSVLEIIDGNKRKAFTIETNLEENNLLKIFYEVSPGG